MGQARQPAFAPQDQRTKSACIFGAVCPALSKGAGLVLPRCNTEAMALHLIEISGSVVVSAQKLGVRVHLVEPFADRHLWAASYEAQLDEIVRLPRQIAGTIAKELSGRLTPVAEVRLAAGTPRIQPKVYEACMTGRLFWNRRTESDLEKGIERFEQAIALDPSYPEAYVGIADSLIMLGIFGLRPPRQTFPQTRAAAEKALELDTDHASAQTSLGTILDTYYWDAYSAKQRFKRALELNPNSATAHQWYGSHLSAVGRNQEAVALVEKARTLDPLSLVMNAFLGLTYFKARQFTRAVEAIILAPNIVERDPGSNIVERDSGSNIVERDSGSEIARILHPYRIALFQEQPCQHVERLLYSGIVPQCIAPKENELGNLKVNVC